MLPLVVCCPAQVDTPAKFGDGYLVLLQVVGASPLEAVLVVVCIHVFTFHLLCFYLAEASMPGFHASRIKSVFSISSCIVSSADHMRIGLSSIVAASSDIALGSPMYL